MSYPLQQKMAPRQFARPRKRSLSKRLEPYKLPIGLILLHIPLGPLLYTSQIFSLAHPLIAFLVGINFAIKKQEPIEKVAYAAAYMVGAEILWRMSGSPIFWEFGKYGAALMMIIALVQRAKSKIPETAIAYIACLLPGALITLFSNSFGDARSKLSFNLSGPVFLFVACWFFSNVTVDVKKLRSILVSLAVPVVSVGVATLFYTITTPDITFNGESNTALSGGFGPNQVSAILGLGAFACLVSLLIFENEGSYKLFFGLLAVFFSAQSIMTFSRGGMYAAIGATVVVALFQMRSLSKAVKRLVPIIALGLLFLWFVFPYMNQFTGGKLEERFEDRGTTHRAEIVELDIQVFFMYPVFGTGVGESEGVRSRMAEYGSESHTEFSRLLSEHGTFGILALASLGLFSLFNFTRQKNAVGKALVAGAIVWSALFMLNAGMRLAAPSLMWGLSAITISGSVRRRRFIIRRKKKKGARGKDVEAPAGDISEQGGPRIP